MSEARLTFATPLPPRDPALTRWASDFLRRWDQVLEDAIRGIILGGWRAGHVPRYIWYQKLLTAPELDWLLPCTATMEVDLHFGDAMPEGGPWVVLTVTPEAVAMAIGQKTATDRFRFIVEGDPRPIGTCDRCGTYEVHFDARPIVCPECMVVP